MIQWRWRLAGWVRRHPWRAAGLALLAGFLLLNVLAYRHAGAMLAYSPDAARTPTPQSLSAWQKASVLVCGVTVPRPENTRSPADVGLAAETVRFTADDGVGLEGWLVAPAGPRGTVLLFPGYAAARSSLLDEGRAFHDVGYAALLMDFRGAGGSDGSANSMGYHEAMDVAAAARYARGRGLPGPLVLYGQSMGGAAVLRAVAALGVRPDAVIVESVFGRMLGAARNRFALMGVPSFPAAELLVFWGGVRAGLPGFDHNPAEFARACDRPALVLHGAEDRHARPEEGQAIYDSLGGRKELVIVPGAGHTSLLLSDPERWRAAVREFLAGVRPPSPGG
jgi:alpha-beta hydrolase superfamily lysophospholipase